jgi:plastocyanin
VLPFNPGNPKDVTRTPNATYDGTSYYNSGLLTTVPPNGDPGPLIPGTKWYPDYQLTFPDTGDFSYLCLVHGMMMKGTVHVLPSGMTLPFTQQDYDQQAADMADYIRLDGRRMLHRLRQHSDNHHVIVGGDDGKAISMLFVHRRVVIHRGQKVTFTNPVINHNAGRGEPHTVTFGDEKMGPDLMSRYGHPWHYRGGQLSSGEMMPGDSFTVRFRKPGTYHYICVLHDAMGMKGTVVVRPRKR